MFFQGNAKDPSITSCKIEANRIDTYSPAFFTIQIFICSGNTFESFIWGWYPKANTYASNWWKLWSQFYFMISLSLWYWDLSCNISECWNYDHIFSNATIQTMDILIAYNYLIWKYSEWWQCKISCSLYNIQIYKIENYLNFNNILVNL